tara:strand:- start:1824 stop:2057 length:234 start_codon:yes stop_codon:yes gene_type:complete
MNPISNSKQILLHESDVAKKLGVSESWLQKKRVKGDGPKFVKLGRAVRYPEGEVDAFIENNMHHSTSENSALPKGVL